MDAIIAPNTVALAQADGPPPTGTPGYATDGNPAAQIPATKFPAYHYNGVIEELLAVIDAGGLVPNRASLTQVRDAIGALIAGSPRLTRAVPFTANGSWTAPAGITLARMRAWGPGGPGASSASPLYPGGGGGGGGYAEGIYTVVPGQTYPVTVSGGLVAGAPGVASSVGTFLSAASGGAGQPGSNAGVGAGGAGGSGSNGTVANLTGSPGTTGINYTGGQGPVEGGMGGTAMFAPGPSRAVGGTATGFAANNGVTPGGGSTGCIGATATSGGGLVIIEY